MIQYVLAIGYLNIACVTLSRQAQLKGSITLGMGYFSEDSQVEMFSHLSLQKKTLSATAAWKIVVCVMIRVSNCNSCGAKRIVSSELYCLKNVICVEQYFELNGLASRDEEIAPLLASGRTKG